MDKIKLSRELIAKMVGNNPQAIKAIENMHLVAQDVPDHLKSVHDLAQLALDSAIQAIMMASQQIPSPAMNIAPVVAHGDAMTVLAPVAYYDNNINYLGGV